MPEVCFVIDGQTDRQTLSLVFLDLSAKNYIRYRTNKTNSPFSWQWLEPSNERPHTRGLSRIQGRLSFVYKRLVFRKKSDRWYLSLDNVHPSSRVVWKMLHIQVHQSTRLKGSINLPQVFVDLLLNCKVFQNLKHCQDLPQNLINKHFERSCELLSKQFQCIVMSISVIFLPMTLLHTI